jgi:thiol-disulfide isomerase/thioredoxin
MHKKNLIIVSIIVIITLFIIKYFYDANKINHVAVPNLNISLLDGGNINLRQIQEPVILINFWASWCRGCVEELPDMLKLAKEYEDKISLVLISLDDNEDMLQSFLNKFSSHYPNLLDNKNIYLSLDNKQNIALKVFGVAQIPLTVILDSNRELVTKLTGFVDWQDPKLIDKIKQLF